MHVGYWAASIGDVDFIRDYILLGLKFSPFVGTYHNRSILSGAIIGRQVEVINTICSYKYLKTPPAKTKNKSSLKSSLSSWCGKKKTT
jgi:hypothetical protein